MRARTRILLLLGMIVIGSLVGTGAPVATTGPTEYRIVISVVSDSVLREISEAPAFRHALQILADQGEEADLQNGVMVSDPSSSNTYEEVRFAVTNKETGRKGEYVDLVFTRMPDGAAFVYFEGEDPQYTCVAARGGWSGWVPTGNWDCLYRWACLSTHQGIWIEEYRVKGSQTQYRWKFCHCKCGNN